MYPEGAVIEDILVATAAPTQNIHIDERLEGRQQPECDYMDISART
jgi:hypothetical protein